MSAESSRNATECVMSGCSNPPQGDTKAGWCPICVECLSKMLVPLPRRPTETQREPIWANGSGDMRVLRKHGVRDDDPHLPKRPTETPPLGERAEMNDFRAGYEFGYGDGQVGEYQPQKYLAAAEPPTETPERGES